MPTTPNQKAQAHPACLEATLVRLITELFWAKVVRGIEKARDERMDVAPSFLRLPRMRSMSSSPSVATRLASDVAVTSPMHSMLVITKTTISGTIAGG